MITTIMAGFAFGYCVVDIIISIRNKQRDKELLEQILGETEK
ncbi:MAG: hypothetical protein ACO3CQ_02655 [Candidatus Nanopelagicaceae bacterium]